MKHSAGRKARRKTMRDIKKLLMIGKRMRYEKRPYGGTLQKSKEKIR